MQTPAADKHPPRYYHLVLQEDMLEGWTLIKESGRQGGGGRIKREHYATREEAEWALVQAREAQIKRGYRVVFVQGVHQNGK